VSKTIVRITKQRRVILDVLSKLTSHPTADEIFDMVRVELPRISLGTVYRNLEFLSSQGLLQKLDQSPGQRRFDANTTLHLHARCLQCGRICDLPFAAVGDIHRLVGSQTGFHVTGYRLEFVGSCSDCRQL
jgi:Fur family transcriptional regulator, ferric uptake regulator